MKSRANPTSFHKNAPLKNPSVISITECRYLNSLNFRAPFNQFSSKEKVEQTNKIEFSLLFTSNYDLKFFINYSVRAKIKGCAKDQF